MPGKYDIASMAMSGMGLKGKDLPKTESGEVDYEALLKMPWTAILHTHNKYWTDAFYIVLFIFFVVFVLF